jgi:erythromycin esterase
MLPTMSPVSLRSSVLLSCLCVAACSSTSEPPPAQPEPPPTSPPSTPPPPSPPVARRDFRPGSPPGWFSSTSRTDIYEAGIDRGERRTGDASAYLRNMTTNTSSGAFIAMSQVLNAAPFRGKRVRLSGWVYADSIVTGGGGLWMRIDEATRTVGFDNMIGFGRPIAGTIAWHEAAVVLDVPQAAISITLGALLNGRGILRVDDLRVDTVPTNVPVTGSASPTTFGGDSVANTLAAARYSTQLQNADFEGLAPTAPASAGTWLNANAVPFTSDAPGSGLDDLAEIGRMVGGARVVALGEATHGTREFFRMKHRVFEYLVERHGVRWFTIEATMPESRDVDRYVTHGVGNPAVLLSRLQFWTWNTREVLDLIEWMRAYNVRVGAPRLRFLGFDMQSPDVSVDSVRRITARLDTTLGARAARITACLDPARAPSNGRMTSTQYQSNTTVFARTLCQDSLSALQRAVIGSRTALLGRADAETVDWLEQYATLLWQWARMAGATTGGSFIRDEAMADNLEWATLRETGDRFFAWAHNYHVSRRPNTMGFHLGRRLGSNYLNLAFTFGTGTFNAVLAGVGGLRTHTIDAVDSTSIEWLFQQGGQPRLLFDTRKLQSGGSDAAVLRDRPVRMRSIGSVYSATTPAAYFEDVLLPADYDGIIWFRSTSPSVLLPFQ